ncbi:aminotransferase [alpha proteobacterium BAL199]|nr:aminotransferase [alpha proteobacterium BAL199]
MTTLQTATTALMDITPRPPVVFASGHGSWLYDTAGRRYLDLVQGWAVTCLGHSPATIVKALTEQAGRLINCSPAYYNEVAIRLAEGLVGASGLDQVFFTNSGAEANEGAIKLARKWGTKHRGGAYEIITMENGFHGRTLATMSASGKPAWKDLFEPKVPGFTKVPLGNLAAVEAAIGDRTVAVMLEPIQGEAGVIPAGADYLRKLRALTERRGILLILDEIQTGMGRTGRMFGFEQSGVQPDVMTLGKGLGGGVPLAALLAREDACCFEYGDQGGTFNGNPLMCAVGSAVLAEIGAPGFLERVQAASGHLQRGLERLASRHGFGAVRGQGLLVALDLTRPVGPTIVEAALAKGLLVNAPRQDTLRFMPALTISDDEIDQAIALLDRVCADLDEKVSA